MDIFGYAALIVGVSWLAIRSAQLVLVAAALARRVARKIEGK